MIVGKEFRRPFLSLPKIYHLIALSFYACQSKVGPSVRHEIVVNPTARDGLFKIWRERGGWAFENNFWEKRESFYLNRNPIGKESYEMKKHTQVRLVQDKML